MYFTVAVINYGTGDLVRRFLDSLMDAEAQSGGVHEVTVKEVLVVDSGFPEVAGAAHFVRPAKYPWPVRLIQNAGHSYSSGVNKAMAAATTEWVVVSNSDVECVDYNQLGTMIVQAVRAKGIAVMCPQLLYPGGEWQRSYGNVPGLLEALKFGLCLDVVDTLIKRACHRRQLGRFSTVLPGKPRSVGYADGAFLLLNKPVFDSLGGFDESFRFYAEETDYAERARRAGYAVCFLNVSPVVHVRGGTVQRISDKSGNAEQLWKAQMQFIRKHKGLAYLRVYQGLLLVGALCREGLFTAMFGLTRRADWRRRAEASRRLSRFLRAGPIGA